MRALGIAIFALLLLVRSCSAAELPTPHADPSVKIDCDVVRYYVATYPAWLIEKFKAVATAKQLADGAKCFPEQNKKRARAHSKHR